MNAPPPDQPINAARHVLLALAETFDLVAGYCDDGGHRKLCLATKATRAKALRRLVLVTFGAANERAWSRAPARSPEAGALAGPRFCRCARSLSVGELRARIGRALGGRDMGARNLRLASSDLEKLRDDGATLASLLGTAAARGPRHGAHLQLRLRLRRGGRPAHVPRLLRARRRLRDVERLLKFS